MTISNILESHYTRCVRNLITDAKAMDKGQIALCANERVFILGGHIYFLSLYFVDVHLSVKYVT